ncbi:MAG: PAS domain-containing protein [Pseudomonadota bacterium]|nr:PAS domain-containing protein [Pseudomonadota bacterium]
MISQMAHSDRPSEQQKAAEADVEGFRDDLGPFVVAADETRMAMVFTNAKEAANPIVYANQAFLELTGWDRDEVLGESFNSLMARGASPEALKKIENAVGGDHEEDPEICYRRKDGSQFWASIFITPVKDEQGKVVQHFASFVDLTRHKAEQATCKLLIDELNHRVKNTLATVQSIVKQALRTATDPALIRESIESRVFALSRSHDILSQENWTGAGLHDLIDAALEPFAVTDGRAERFTVEGANIRLLPKATLALGIAFHELATNAFKYGAFSNNAGTVSIAWTIEPSPAGDRLILHWREKDGPEVTPPTRKGFGTQVVERGLAHELKGEVHLDYRPEGVVCTIDVPAPRVAENS